MDCHFILILIHSVYKLLCRYLTKYQVKIVGFIDRDTLLIEIGIIYINNEIMKKINNGYYSLSVKPTQ